MADTKIVVKDYTKAVTSLKEALELVDDDLTRDGAIQRFEFVIELSWKLLQAMLKDRKIEAYSLRSTYQEAFKEGLIEDVETWLTYWDVRNLTTRTYREEVAKQVFEQLDDFLDLAEVLAANINRELSKTD